MALSVTIPPIAVVHLNPSGRAVTLRTNTSRVPAVTDTWLVLDAGGHRLADLGAVQRDVMVRAAGDPGQFSSGADVPLP